MLWSLLGYCFTLLAVKTKLLGSKHGSLTLLLLLFMILYKWIHIFIIFLSMTKDLSVSWINFITVMKPLWWYFFSFSLIIARFHLRVNLLVYRLLERLWYCVNRHPNAPHQQTGHTSPFKDVVTLPDNQFIKCIWFVAPGSYLPS